MSNQLRLDLNDEDPNAWRRPKFPERLFIGILLDVSGGAQAEAEARRICKAKALQGKILLKERLHVTLQHIGDYKRLKSRICYAASLVCAAISMSPFDVPFDRAESFPAPPRRGFDCLFCHLDSHPRSTYLIWKQVIGEMNRTGVVKKATALAE